MVAIDYLRSISFAVGGLWSTERPREKASGSEFKRWFKKGSVIINGTKAAADSNVTCVTSLILHPKGRRITLL